MATTQDQYQEQTEKKSARPEGLKGKDFVGEDPLQDFIERLKSFPIKTETKKLIWSLLTDKKYKGQIKPFTAPHTAKIVREYRVPFFFMREPKGRGQPFLKWKKGANVPKGSKVIDSIGKTSDYNFYALYTDTAKVFGLDFDVYKILTLPKEDQKSYCVLIDRFLKFPYSITASGGLQIIGKGPYNPDKEDDPGPFPKGYKIPFEDSESFDLIVPPTTHCLALYQDPCKGFKDWDSFCGSLVSVTQAQTIIDAHFIEYPPSENLKKDQKKGEGPHNWDITKTFTGGPEDDLKIIEMVKNGCSPTALKKAIVWTKKLAKNPKKTSYLDSKFYAQTPIEKRHDTLKNIDESNPEYIDDYSFLPKKELSVISGPKIVGKTSATIALQLKSGANILYFSYREVKKKVIRAWQRQAEKKGWTGSIEWFDLLDLDADAGFGELEAVLEKYKAEKKTITCIHEDPGFAPPWAVPNKTDVEGLRIYIDSRRHFATKWDLHWALGRNLNKKDEIFGSRYWEHIPRNLIKMVKVQEGATQWDIENKKRKGLEKLSIMYVDQSNEGAPIKEALLFKLFENKEIGQHRIPDVDYQAIKMPHDIDAFCKGQSKEQEAENETMIDLAVGLLNKKNSLMPPDFRRELIEAAAKVGIKFSTPQAKRLISTMKDKMKIIEGGGRGKGCKPYKLNKKGKSLV